MTDFTKPEHTAHRFHNSPWLNPITLPLFGLADVATGLVTGRKGRQGTYSLMKDDDNKRLIEKEGGMFGSDSSSDDEDKTASSSDEEKTLASTSNEYEWNEKGVSSAERFKGQKNMWKEDREMYYNAYFYNRKKGFKMDYEPEEGLLTDEEIVAEYPNLADWITKKTKK